MNNFTFTESQHSFFCDDINPIIALSGGYGSGKSETGLKKSFKNLIINQDKNLLCVAPTDRLLKTGMIPKFQSLFDSMSINYKMKNDLMIMVTPYGNIYFRTGSSPEKIVDFEVGTAWIDEPGIQDEEVKDRSMARVRQKARLSQTLFTGTPEPGKKSDWWNDFAENENVTLYFASTRETINCGFIDKDYIKNLEKIYSPKMLESYIEGKFVDLNTDIFYYNFRKELHCKELLFQPEKPVLLSFDFNVNPLCVSIAQSSPNNTKLYFIDEIRLEGSDTMQAMDIILEKYSDTKMFYVYGDASARARDTRNSKRTDLDIIIQSLIKDNKKYCNFVNISNPSIRKTQNKVNGLLAPADLIPKILFSNKLKYIIKDMIKVTGDKKADEKRGIGHFSDNIRYIIDKIFPNNFYMRG